MRACSAAFIGGEFRFCLCCGVSYLGRTGKLTKLATLSSEGRSTATTLLSMAAVQGLRKSDLSASARKILSFTDNRQDASLQAGHFNDFVFVASLRAGLARALTAGQPHAGRRGPEGLRGPGAGLRFLRQRSECAFR